MIYYKGDIVEVLNFGKTTVYMKDGWECDYYGNHLAKRIGNRFKVKQVSKDNTCLWVDCLSKSGSFETPDFYYISQLMLYKRPFKNHIIHIIKKVFNK
jgi:hypothetical protein